MELEPQAVSVELVLEHLGLGLGLGLEQELESLKRVGDHTDEHLHGEQVQKVTVSR